jgi:hypothetical protein
MRDEPTSARWDGSPESLHLPTVVNAPGIWSGTEGATGPLAALGLALRNFPEGLTGERQRVQLYGVSAVDGRATWIDLPGVDEGSESLEGWFALSPDGKSIGWSRQRGSVLLGWSIMDVTTGVVHDLVDPEARRLRDTMADLSFSGDSRYLLTNYEKPGFPQVRGHQFVAWDVEEGTPTILEPPGYYWLPNLGSAPDGVVWSRKTTLYRQASSGARSTYALPRWAVTASWGPNGKAFAYVGHPPELGGSPWRLYAGPSIEQARDHVLPIDLEPAQILGWRDDTHVVVGRFGTTVYVVGIVTGEAEKIDMTGYGEQVNAPLLAGDLWRNDLQVPVAPSGTTDPRRPYRWGGGAVLALLAVAAFLLWRRDALPNRQAT